MNLSVALFGPRRAAARLIRRADMARDAGTHSEAARLYSRALKLDSARTDIYVQYGNMLKEIGRYEEAEGAYRRALSQSPGDGEIHLQLGHLLKITGRSEQAAEAYEEARRVLPDSSIPGLELRNLRARPPQSGSDALLDEPECERHIREGDRLRDAGRYADAAGGLSSGARLGALADRYPSSIRKYVEGLRSIGRGRISLSICPGRKA